MQNCKFGVLVCGLFGLVGCFLPIIPGFTFFDTRQFDAPRVYLVMFAFTVTIAIAAMGISKRMQRWMAALAAVCFGFATIKLRSEHTIIDTFGFGVGAKLMATAVVGGLVFSILAVIKPERA